MCDPISLTALGLTAAGTYGQYRAQKQRNSDMRRMNLAETERQDKYYAESKRYLDENQEVYDRDAVDENMAIASADRQAQYAAADRNAPRANTTLPGAAASGNTVVADAFRRALAGAAAEASARGAAKADMASFSDFMQDAAIQTGRNSGNIGMMGSFSQGSSNVLPLELNYAATRPRTSATVGNLLVALGSSMAGSGANSFGQLFGTGSKAAANAAAKGVGKGLFKGLAGRGP